MDSSDTGDCQLLTEAEIQRSYRKIISESKEDPSAFDRAEELLEELRLESPLRHRLSSEIDELRELASAG